MKTSVFNILSLSTFLFVSSASAHEWYAPDCCSGSDCAPVEDGGVKETASGYVLPNGEAIPFGDPRLRPSHDYQYHWCHAQNPIGFQKTYCLYIPGRGT